jgi:large subunit ribosomal protein L9
MNVILLDKVENLGAVGDLVTVKSGYGRNYLIPSGKAALATPVNIKEIELRRDELEKQAAQELSNAKSRAELIKGMELIIPANVTTEGKLYGSVGPVDITNGFEKVGVEISKSEIRMPDGPIQEIGEFNIDVHLHADIDVEIKIIVVPDQ